MFRNESFVLEDTLMESSSSRGASLVLGERLHRDPQSTSTNYTSTLQQEQKHLAEDVSFRREAKERYRNSDLESDINKYGHILPTGQWYAPSAVIIVAKM